MNEIDLQNLSKTELTKYLSDHRNDSEKFSAGLQELMNRQIWTTVEASTPPEIEAQIIKDAIEAKKRQ